MTAHRATPNQLSAEMLDELAHLVSVPCPQPPDGCGQPIGQDCVQPKAFGDPVDAPRQPRRGPGCWRRVKAADEANPAKARPAMPPEPAEPVRRRLVDAARLRRDLASYREPCRWCTRPVVWALNPSGHRVPVDPEPAEDGVLVVTVDDRGVRCTEPLTGRALRSTRAFGQRMHQPHRNTCPKGDRWSRHHPTHG